MIVPRIESTKKGSVRRCFGVRVERYMVRGIKKDYSQLTTCLFKRGHVQTGNPQILYGELPYRWLPNSNFANYPAHA